MQWLFYMWNYSLITDTAKMVGTILVVHTISTWENAALVPAKANLYTPKERKWMQANIPMLWEAGIMESSFSPWSQGTKFASKTDGDLHMVHVYCPINIATISNMYPMKRIETGLKNFSNHSSQCIFRVTLQMGIGQCH